MAKHQHDFDSLNPVDVDISMANDIAVETDVAERDDGDDRAKILVQFLSQAEGFAAAAPLLGGRFARPVEAKDGTQD